MQIFVSFPCYFFFIFLFSLFTMTCINSYRVHWRHFLIHLSYRIERRLLDIKLFFFSFSFPKWISEKKVVGCCRLLIGFTCKVRNAGRLFTVLFLNAFGLGFMLVFGSTFSLSSEYIVKPMSSSFNLLNFFVLEKIFLGSTLAKNRISIRICQKYKLDLCICCKLQPCLNRLSNKDW